MADRQYLVRFGPNANCTFELCTIDESVYGYRPSLPANIAFAALFSTATIVHIILGIKWKTWWFMWCMILGSTHEVAGYVGRIILYINPWSFVAFIIQIICITQAPVFYCAAIYVLLGQTIENYSPSLARFPTKYFLWIFLPCDIISLTLQGVGGSLSAASSGDDETGVNIAMAGLIFQIVTLFAFCGLFGDYLVRLFRSAKPGQISPRQRIYFSFLSLAVLVTLIRCIFRADELKAGYHGELITREDLFIGLEGVLIVVSIFCLCLGHPGYAFNDKTIRYSQVTRGEVTGQLLPHGIEMAPKPAVDRYYSYESGGH